MADPHVVPAPHRGARPGGDTSPPGTPPLRIVVVARPVATNRHVFAAAASAARIEQVLTDVHERPRQGVGRLLRSPSTAARTVRVAVLRRLEARLERQIAALLDDDAAFPVFADVTRLTAAQLNGEEGAALLRAVDPDVLVLSGAPMLRPHVYRIPRLGTVNLHWGIAPDYRGQQSIFTAMRRRDYGAVGITLHHVDEGVDTGPVLAQGWPALDPADTLAAVWAKTARLGATLLVELLEQLTRGPVRGERKPGPGVVVRGRDRRVWHHLAHAAGTTVLRRRPTSTAERTARCWSPPGAPGDVPAPRGPRDRERTAT